MFTFTFNDETTVEVDDFKIPFGVSRKIRKLDEADQMFTLLEELLDEETLNALDAQDTEEVGSFVEQWAKANEADPKASKKSGR